MITKGRLLISTFITEQIDEARQVSAYAYYRQDGTKLVTFSNQ